MGHHFVRGESSDKKMWLKMGFLPSDTDQTREKMDMTDVYIYIYIGIDNDIDSDIDIDMIYTETEKSVN